MERDQYKFRSKARVVAFVDLILSSMSLCLCLIFFVGLLRLTSMASDNDALLGAFRGKSHSSAALELDLGNGKEPDGDGAMADGTGGTGGENDMRSGIIKSNPNMPVPNTAIVKLMWIFLALISIMTAAQILAAVRLLNATQIGKDPIGAMKLCRFWRRVCIFFSGLLIFNFLSSFRQRGENFFEVSFLLTSILVRIVALYIVQQFVNELDVAIVSTLPIRRHHHPTSSHLPPSMGGGDNLAYAYGPQYAMAVPPQPQPTHAPPPKYDDVVKEPYKFSEA